MTVNRKRMSGMARGASPVRRQAERRRLGSAAPPAIGGGFEMKRTLAGARAAGARLGTTVARGLLQPTRRGASAAGRSAAARAGYTMAASARGPQVGIGGSMGFWRLP